MGHEEIMPTNYVKTDSHDKTPSDLDYFTMGGLRDNIPDVFYGRFVVDSMQDLEVQVLKTIQFEKGLMLINLAIRDRLVSHLTRDMILLM